MILDLFRNPRRPVIEALYGSIAAASRARSLYATLSVPDTVEGRFECLSLHVVLALRALRRLPPPAADVAQDLVNYFFGQLDASLREMGVGDVTVPKRMKRMAQAFYGRAAAYDEALDQSDEDALAAALGRNVIGSEAVAPALAAYALASERELAGQSLDALLARGVPFPQPDRFSGVSDPGAFAS